MGRDHPGEGESYMIRERKDNGRKLQVAGIWIGAASLAVAIFRAIVDVWTLGGGQ